MIKIFLCIFLIFLSSSYLRASSIYDFQINSFGLGDSLIRHFTMEEINEGIKNEYAHDDKYVNIQIKSSEIEDLNENNRVNLKIEIEDVDNQYVFAVDTEDNHLTVHSIGIGKFYLNDTISECLSYKDSTLAHFKSIFPNIDPDSYESPYDDLDDGKSIAYVTDFKLDEGSVRIYCVDWSAETTKKRNWEDNFQIKLSTSKFVEWLSDK